MLKRFFITVLGSFVGTWLALIISSVMSILLSFAMLGALANSEMKSTSKISDNSVLLLDLGIVVSDRGSNDDVFSSIYGDTKTVGLIDLLRQIESASEKKEIKGMLITCKGISAGMSSLYEIREAIARFKETGKFVYAYGYQAIGQADYYLASQADSIYQSRSRGRPSRVGISKLVVQAFARQSGRGDAGASCGHVQKRCRAIYA